MVMSFAGACEQCLRFSFSWFLPVVVVVIIIIMLIMLAVVLITIVIIMYFFKASLFSLHFYSHA